MIKSTLSSNIREAPLISRCAFEPPRCSKKILRACTAVRLFGALAAVALTSACGNAGGKERAVASVRFTGQPHLEVVRSGGAGVVLRDSLEFLAAMSIEAEALTVRVRLRNASRDSVYLEWGACSMSPQLYKTDSLRGRPVFDWQQRPNPDPEVGPMFCQTYLKEMKLAPGDSLAPREFIEGIAVRRLAGDSLAPGRYYLGAEVYLKVPALGNSDQRIVVPAGIVHLSR
jgi:hypothetical protein